MANVPLMTKVLGSPMRELEGRARTRNRRIPIVCLIGLVGAACASGETTERTVDVAAELSATTPVDTARFYAEQVMNSLGGKEAWDRTRYISYRWLVEREGSVVADRSHAWDRYDGHYRVEFEQRDSTHLMLFNVNALQEIPELGSVPTGRAWVGDRELTGAARDTALRRGYSVFINDSYWALMPFKWEDPGVHLAYEGTRALSDGNQYAVVHLTFDEGLGVSEDQYWGFVDPTTGRMAAWQYLLGSDTEPGDVIWWEDPSPVGPLRFPMNRVRDGAGRFIYFDDVVMSATVPAGRFDPPSP